MFAHRNERLNELQRDYRVAATHRHNETADALLTRFGLAATEGGRVRLIRKLIEVEINALNDLRLGDEANFNASGCNGRRKAACHPNALPLAT